MSSIDSRDPRRNPQSIEAFATYCVDSARAVRSGKVALPDAVDALYRRALSFGLVRSLGEDAVQHIMAEAFKAVRQ
jgi:hypothetical protein